MNIKTIIITFKDNSDMLIENILHFYYKEGMFNIHYKENDEIKSIMVPIENIYIIKKIWSKKI